MEVIARARAFVWALGLGVLFAGLSQAATQLPKRAVLHNGMTLIVAEDHTAQVVALRAYVKAGSIHEGQWLGCGLSHFLEHTLDEGTTSRSAQEIDALVESLGNSANAYTTHDHTCYHITAASQYFEQALDVLSDYLMHAALPEREVEVQRGVILNEFRMGYDDPQQVLHKLFYETAFKVHPARVPIIGLEDRFRQATRQDLHDYYQRMYVPRNIVFVVAGDVETDVVLEKLARTFEGWRGDPPPEPPVAIEAPQTELRRATLRRDVHVEYAMIGFHTIPLIHPDLFALDVLANILGSGASSRLYQKLHEEERLVHTISAFSHTPSYDGGVFGIDLTLDPGNHATAERRIFREIERVKRVPVTDQEMAKAKRQVEAAYVFAQESVDGRAAQLGTDEISAGDFQFSRRYVEGIRGVTKPDIMRVAEKYLRPENCTIAAVVPQSYEGAVNTGLSIVAAAAEQGATTRRTVLGNGAVVLTRHNPQAPSVSVIALTAGGVRCETEHNNGIYHLMSRLLTRGTPSRTDQEIDEAMDRMGGSLSSFSANNTYGLEMTVLSSDFEPAMAIFCDCLLNACFPEEEVESAREDQLAAIARAQDQWPAYAHDWMRAALYTTHPYRMSPLGTEESVKRITRADLVELHRRTLCGEGLFVGVFGDVAHDKAITVAERCLGRLPRGPAEMPPVPAEPPRTQETVVKRQRAGAQAVIYMGMECGPMNSDDLYAVGVLDAVLSGMSLPGGRLHSRLRGSQLVYVVHSFTVRGPETGYFATYAACEPANVDRVLAAIDEEFDRIQQELVPEEELERGRRMCVSEYAIGLQTNLAQAQEYVLNEFYGLGWEETERYVERIGSVTAEDVRQAACKYLRNDRRAVVIVSP